MPELPPALLALTLLFFSSRRKTIVVFLRTLHTEAEISDHRDRKSFWTTTVTKEVYNCKKCTGIYSCQRTTALWPLVILTVGISSYNTFVISSLAGCLIRLGMLTCYGKSIV